VNTDDLWKRALDDADLDGSAVRRVGLRGARALPDVVGEGPPRGNPRVRPTRLGIPSS
jgi:hypothetical protein